GGFHPVELGDCFDTDGRFRVAHKLGFGGYGTVWLCRDSIMGKWRALKIMAAQASEQAQCPDLQAIDFFSKFGPKELEDNHIVSPLHHFFHDGPNGHHLCVVLPWLGSTLQDFNKVYAHCSSLAKDICFQLVEAMHFLHANGLCHGDFRNSNIMFHLSDGID
ncbi:kinase-like domain-containing protein, partial [Bombardia bombarda]